MQQLELDDIQGLVIRGYGNLSAACFMLLQIVDRQQAKSWLKDLVPRITAGNVRPDTQSLNLAFSYPGLVALGLDPTTLDGFSEDFQAGMVTPHKQRALGDTGASAPETWAWGGSQADEEAIHLLLMLYAVDDAALERLSEELRTGFEAGGVKQIYQTLETVKLAEPKEHFGFRDGISQPIIEGLPKAQGAENPITAGEFILGYSNAYGRYTQRPLVKADAPHAGELPRAAEVDKQPPDTRDLGKNGTYLVFRQLQQDVKGFWDFVKTTTQQEDGSTNTGASIRLAAKMVGRWPSGAPVTSSPEQDDPNLATENSFNYHNEDAQGLKCPFGAHIRRTHPRDSLDPEPGSQKSLDFANRHRILRRGRVYGQPLAGSMQPEEIMAADGDGERGLHFICLNANISRQFEFVQQTWANDPRFNGLYHDPDPIMGPAGGSFTEQARPVRKAIHNLPQFVRVRGGGYFFLPGIKALHYLAAG